MVSDSYKFKKKTFLMSISCANDYLVTHHHIEIIEIENIHRKIPLKKKTKNDFKRIKIPLI